MKWVLGLILMGMSLMAQAAGLPHGYIQDTRAEREERYYEIFLFAEPPVRQRPLRDVIFNPELSAEFRARYRDRFGQIDTESINYQHTDFDRFDNNRGFVREVEQQNDARRDFAAYMMKRLFEWHLDNYVKSEPAMRPVYELKEKLKKVEVKVTKETKLEMKYSLAGNILEFVLQNPIADTRLELDMDPTAFGPSSVQEQKLISTLPINNRMRVENTAYDHQGRDRIEVVKVHTPNLSTSYGINTAYKDTEVSGETRVSLGFGYSF